MSGFSGIWVFDKELVRKDRGFTFPEKINGFFPLIREIDNSEFRLAWYSNNKFPKDSFMIENSGRIKGLDGVVLTNGPDRNKEYSFKDFVTDISKTRGSFTACFKNDTSGEFALFADQTGSRQLFYFWDKRFFAFSSSIFLLNDIIRHFNITPSLSMPACYMMISLGYLLEDLTLISEIKKVKAGHFILASAQGIYSEKYHDYYRKTQHKKINRELLQEIDHKFKDAIRLEYEKDIDYGYNHIATLSGGLDSRLNVMLANKYGYKNITCLTFSEGFKSDELTARKITGDLSLKHIILLLNNGFQLFDIETPLILNNCAVYYFGAAQTLVAVKNINFSEFGLFHNGGLAESSKGGYLSGREYRAPSLSKRYAVSEKLFDRIDKSLLNNFFGNYQNEEMFVTYNRGFNAIHNGSWMTLPFTDSVSTYMELDFADLAYSINPEIRYGGYLTVEWIKRLHPEIGKYPWHFGQKPTNNKVLLFKGRVVNKLKQILTGHYDSPVPLNHWYSSNHALRHFIESRFNQSKGWEILSNDLEKDLKGLFFYGSVSEKLLCISFLTSVELLFNKELFEK